MSTGTRGASPGAATRGLAARAVAQVLGAGRTLDEALAGLEPAPADARDRAQVRALAYGALRWHHRHRILLKRLLERPLGRGEWLLEALLSVGLFQLLDDQQPDHAAVAATVAAARWLGRPRAAGLVNATLRRMQRERESLLAFADATPEGRNSHPAWLVRSLQHDWPDAWQSVLDAAQRRPPLWLRVNLRRQSAAGYLARLTAAGLPAEAGELPGSVRLGRAVGVTDLPGFAAGEVSVQDLAAQLAVHLLAPQPGLRVLDACAAPGGKAAHLLELTAGRLELTALDVDAARLERLRANLTRLGLAAEVLTGDACRPQAWWDGRTFDLILVDAPCSATGVIRRHPDIKWLRRETDIAPLASRQRDMLEALWPLLAPGGRLLYVTCSILRRENGCVARQLLAAHDDAQLVGVPVPSWACAQPDGGWQVLPGAADTDGLYYALMTRTRA